MTFRSLAKQSEKFVSDNSPAILTGLGVAGTVATAYLTGKATFKAAEIIAWEQDNQNLQERGHQLDTREMFELVWKEYIPAAGMCVVTVACTVMATRIGNRRAAAMAAAYTISERAFSEYREKVFETVGKNKEQKVRDDIAQDRINQTPSEIREVVITSGGDVMCYDTFTGRYFTSDMESIKKAQNDTNYQILNHNYASLNDFYERIGLNRTDIGEELGWNSDKQMEIQFSTTISDDQKPCIAISFRTDPIRNYFRVH